MNLVEFIRSRKCLLLNKMHNIFRPISSASFVSRNHRHATNVMSLVTNAAKYSDLQVQKTNHKQAKLKVYN